jgi:hypothetical protein
MEAGIFEMDNGQDDSRLNDPDDNTYIHVKDVCL